MEITMVYALVLGCLALGFLELRAWREGFKVWGLGVGV